MAGVIEATELLDIEMDQFARPLALIAAHRLGRVDPGQPAKPFPPEPARDSGPRQAEFVGNRRPCHPLAPAQMHDQRHRRRLGPTRDAGRRACAV